MIRRSALTAVARAINAVFFLLTSVYCLLTYSSFAYQQLIRPHLIGSLSNFATLHATLFWLTFGATALTLLPDLRRPGTRAAAGGYLALSIALGVWLSIRQVLPLVENNGRSFVLALLALIPPVVLALVDHRAVGPLHLSASGERRLLKACVATGLFTWAVYAAGSAVRVRGAEGLTLSPIGLWLGIGASAPEHLLVFATAFLVLLAARSAAALARAPGIVEYWLLVVAFAVSIAVTMRHLVFAAIAFTGRDSWMASAAIAANIALVWSAVARRRLADADVQPLTAMTALLAPLTTGRSRLAPVLTLAVVPLAAYLLIDTTGGLDWDFMIQKLSALLVWALSFGLIYSTVSEGRGRPGLFVLLLMPVAALTVHAVSQAAIARLPVWRAAPRYVPEFDLDSYVATNPSFRLIRDWRNTDTRGNGEFFAFLRVNTTIAGDQLSPVPIDFVRPLNAIAGGKPHIFLFVIDSLRRDYLSSYNPAVTFTPSIERFAADSFVFDRAFSRYGGTGLAVPSIWAGGMLIHKQYVTPFDPMNTLLKLLSAERYQLMMSLDSVMVRLFPSTLQVTELDRGVPIVEYDLCRTLDDLRRQLSFSRDGRPVFAYSLPQNLHVSRMRSAPTPAGESYPGFFAPYAATLRRIDACFGDFIDFLTRSGLYDDSIVILTSDHGDSLGEELRWGHAFTIFPEVLRIPLIVHLPPRMRDAVTTDLERVSFSTDISPTLYALLGHEPAALGPLFGATLFVAQNAELSSRRHAEFVEASSYGAVYGMLRQNGRHLYIADAINGKEYAYDLYQNVPTTRVAITDADRALSRRLIRDQLFELAALYHFVPPR